MSTERFMSNISTRPPWLTPREISRATKWGGAAGPREAPRCASGRPADLLSQPAHHDAASCW